MVLQALTYLRVPRHHYVTGYQGCLFQQAVESMGIVQVSGCIYG